MFARELSQVCCRSLVVCVAFFVSGLAAADGPNIDGAWRYLGAVDGTKKRTASTVRAIEVALASDPVYRGLLMDKMAAIRMQAEAKASFRRGVPDLASKIQKALDAQLEAHRTEIIDRLRGRADPEVTILKLITNGRWSVTHTDPNTGRVIHHYGGVYALKGAEYVETVTYASELKASLIGGRFNYALSVEGETLQFAGAGKTIRELWTKAKRSED